MSTLLIVDDESWTRKTVKALINLESMGITQLFEATNGKEAIVSIRENHPDIIITDMKMPGMDGISLLELLGTDFPDIIAIVLSGYQDFMYTRQAIKSGVIEYLPKPVDGVELNEAIRKAVIEKKKKQQLQIGYPFLIEEYSYFEHVLNPLRQKLSFSLKELNAHELSNTMHQLINKVDERCNNDATFISYIHQSFFVLIESVLKEQHLRIEDVGINVKILAYQDKRTLEEEIIILEQIGVQVILAIEEIRKQKSKINLDEIKLYLDNHYSSPHMSLDVIAKRFFVSKEYLTTSFKKKYGCNVTEFIISRRMEQAKQLILTTTLQYKTIAEMVGYEDVSYFYRVFKKFYGASPGKVRKN